MCLLSQLTFLFIITLLAFFIVVFLIYQLNLFIIIFSETVKNSNLPYVPMFTGGTYSRSLKTRPPPLVSSHFQKRKKNFPRRLYVFPHKVWVDPRYPQSKERMRGSLEMPANHSNLKTQITQTLDSFERKTILKT